MLRVGLSGGIGSGKSTVARRLAELGAVIIDADQVAREVVEPGMPALAEIRERFGPSVLTEDGALDRAALGEIVFADERARRDLEAITHPRIHERSAELMDQARDDAVVVHDLPLLVEMGRAHDYALTTIVDVPEQERLRRLVDLRGMPSDQARARIVAQAGDAERRAAADVLLPNTGSVQELHAAVERLWRDRLVPFEANLRQDRHVRRPEVLALVEPDPRWADDASRLLGRVRTALGEHVVRADHVGSTSIPGLVAKDVIDLQVVVEDLAVLGSADVRESLRRVGLVLPQRIWHDHDHTGDAGATWPKRILGTGDPCRVVHCHVRPVDSPAWQLALLFRDWLRAEPEERAGYVRLKQDLRSQGLSTSDYAQAKEPWFAQAFGRAQTWAARTGWSAASG